MGYVMTAVVIFAVAFTGWGVLHIKHETAPTYRPARRVVRRVRPIAAGDPCPCGVGTIGPAGGPAGDMLACTNCDRLWTLEGIKLVRRMRPGMRRTPSSVPEPETTAEEV